MAENLPASNNSIWFFLMQLHTSDMLLHNMHNMHKYVENNGFILYSICLFLSIDSDLN